MDALDGAPGVYSARFAGPGASDAANSVNCYSNASTAHQPALHAYVSVIALILPGQAPRTFRGTVDGEIVLKPKGSGGFGYDPLFFYPPFGATFAEVLAEQKLSVSHRGRAAEKDDGVSPRR